MLERTAGLVQRCREWYAAYEFHRVYHAIHDYCVVDLSAFYYDVLKDRLYTKSPNSKSRRSAQTAVWKITSALVRLAAPILVFTAEELWKFLPKAAGEPESVHMSLFPDADELMNSLSPKATKDWVPLRAVRTEVLSALERARAAKEINGSLEAKVVLSASGDLADILEAYVRFLPELFIVSQVEFRRHPAPPRADQAPIPGGQPSLISDLLLVLGGLNVKIEKADGKKCERCWNYSTHVGENPRYPTICERCSEAIAEIEAGK
jgi:isoleucyl-tRNA synthetase